MIKKIILFVFILASFAAIASESDNAEIEGLKYRKEKTIDMELYFPKKIPDYIDSLLSSQNVESYYELAKIYLILDKKEIANKYFGEYEKKSKDYIKMARYALNSGDEERGKNYIFTFLKNATIEEKSQNGAILKEIVEKYKLDIDVENISVSKKEILFSKTGNEEFLDYYIKNKWSDGEQREIALFLSGKNLENSKRLKDVFTAIAGNELIKRYYFNKITSIFDEKGYFSFYKAMEENGVQFEVKNRMEKLIYFKYKNRIDEYSQELERGKKEAVEDKDYEKLYILYRIEGKNDFKVLYNLALASEKYFYELIKEISDNRFGLDEKYKNELITNFVNGFITTYPNSQYIEEIYKVKLKSTPDSPEKLAMYDEILAKKFVYEFFIAKLKLLNYLLKWSDGEQLAKSYLDKNYPTADCVNELINAMEKQGKQKELTSILENLSEKGYYYEYSEKNKMVIASKEKKKLAEYYMQQKNFDKLMSYREYLDYDDYKKLIEAGESRFADFAAQRFPFDKAWLDVSKSINLYFNENYTAFDESAVKKLELKKDKNDMEKYYMARYYNYKKEYKKSAEIMNDIAPRYRIYKEITQFYIEILKKSGDSGKGDETALKNKILLNWD